MGLFQTKDVACAKAGGAWLIEGDKGLQCGLCRVRGPRGRELGEKEPVAENKGA